MSFLRDELTPVFLFASLLVDLTFTFYCIDIEKSFVLRVMSYGPDKFNYFKDFFNPFLSFFNDFFCLLSDILENLST